MASGFLLEGGYLIINGKWIVWENENYRIPKKIMNKISKTLIKDKNALYKNEAKSML